MKFYRPLKRIEAITFDLDDTLYDNYDVIRRTDSETLKFIQGFHPALAEMSPDAIRLMRAELCDLLPGLFDDLHKMRVIWQIITEVIATQMFVFRSGPFAWNGSIAFWWAVVVFSLGIP